MNASTITPTAFCSALNLATRLGLTYPILANTTLNEKFTVLQGEVPPVGKYPILNYFAIGNGGGSVAFNNYKQSGHAPDEGSLFQHIPFVIRLKTNDLVNVERAKYRLRKEVTIDNKEYVEYYLKKFNDVEPVTFKRIVKSTNNKSIESNYEFEYNKILSPTFSNNVNAPGESVEYLNVSSNIEFILSKAELSEIKNALKIKYGENTSLNITEMALCSGHDEVQPDNTTEAIAVQVNYFMPFDFNLQNLINLDKDYSTKIELGGVLPLSV